MKSFFNKLRQPLKDDKGASIVEFGILAPVFLLMIVATAELGIMMIIQNALDAAAREAGRLGLTGSEGLTAAEREEAIRDRVVAVVEGLSGGLAKEANLTITVKSYEDMENIAQPEPYIDGNANGEYDVGESYTDVNGNGEYDTDQGISESFGLSGQAVDYQITYSWDSIASVMGLADTVTLEGRAAVVNEEF